MKKRRQNTRNFSQDRSNPNRNVYKVTTRQYAARDAPGHTLVKTRVDFQKNYDEIFNKKDEDLQGEKKLLEIQELESQSDVSSDEAWQKKESESPRSDESMLGKRSVLDEPEAAEEPDEEDADQIDEDEEALLAEYERLKALEEANKRVKESDDQSVRTNTLTIRKKWTEDTLFQNQSLKDKSGREQHTNDLLHSDKHRRLLKRYIQT